MKFGKTLLRRAYPPWLKHYINYKHLKKLIKKIKIDSGKSNEVKINPEFFAEIRKEAAKVNALYESKLEEYDQEYASLSQTLLQLEQQHHQQQQQSSVSSSSSSSPSSSSSSSSSSSTSCCSQPEQKTSSVTASTSPPSSLFTQFTAYCHKLDLLRSFVMLNHLGFLKILKKYDKRTKSDFKLSIMEEIMLQPFYRCQRLANLLIQAECVATILTGRASKDDYTCAVCLDILSNPVVLSCAHRFCWHCLAQASVHKQACPVCRKEQSLNPRLYEVHGVLDSFLARHFPEEYKSHHPEGDNNKNINNDVKKDKTKSPGKDKMKSKDVDTDDDDDDDDEAYGQNDQNSRFLYDGKCDSQRIESLAQRLLQLAHTNRPQQPSISPVTTILSAQQPKSTCTAQVDRFDILLKHAKPGAFFALDIDDTIFVSAYDPCSLMTEQGVQAFQAVLGTCNDYQATQEHCQRLQTALYKKRCVEESTASVISTLQEMGCWVFGLTSRYSDMATQTTHTLLELGIDLSKRAPFPKGKVFKDPETQAVCINGIIYTNAQSKSLTLNRFLENVVFRGHLSGLKSPKLPSEIVFIDDRLGNAEDVYSNVSIAKQLNVPVVSYHYVPKVRLDSPPFSLDILRVQIREFIYNQVILNDFEANDVVVKESGVHSEDDDDLVKKEKKQDGIVTPLHKHSSSPPDPPSLEL